LKCQVKPDILRLFEKHKVVDDLAGKIATVENRLGMMSRERKSSI
jgi:hypothetical protein